MKKLCSFIVVLIMLMNISVAVLAEDEDAYATGAVLMTQEELENFKANVPKIIDVKPNALFYERLQEEYSGSFSVEDITQPSAEYGEEIVSSIASETVELMEDENNTLPSKVDNSAVDENGTSTFPMIGDQGNLGACVGWSFGYYQLTNNANRIRGTAARNEAGKIATNVYSPNWVYNLGNNAKDVGMNVAQAMNILYTYGCPTTNLIPVSTSTDAANYRTWYPVSNIWESALYNKCDLYQGTTNPDDLETPIESAESKCLEPIKKVLADGYVVSFETKVYNTTKLSTIVKTGYDANNNEAYVWTEFRNDGEGHALTIVGYDDRFYVDINGNNTEEVGEYGAFKVANSWGTNVNYHNDGYFWIAYDALNKVSAVKTTNHSKRIPALNDNLYYLVMPLKEYKPLLLGTVEIDTKNRKNLTATIGVYDVDDPEEYYEQNITRATYLNYNEKDKSLNEDIAFNGSVGSCNLSGIIGNADIGTVVFDFTLLLNEFEMEENHRYGVYVKLDDPSEYGTAIESFKIKDMYTNNTFEASNDMIVNEKGQAYAEVLYLSSIMHVETTERLVLEFNSNVSEDSINGTNITVMDSWDHHMDIILSLSRNNARKVRVDINEDNGETYTNGFYKIVILPELMSEGGNRLGRRVEKSFYTPFH